MAVDLRLCPNCDSVFVSAPGDCPDCGTHVELDAGEEPEPASPGRGDVDQYALNRLGRAGGFAIGGLVAGAGTWFMGRPVLGAGLLLLGLLLAGLVLLIRR